MTYTQPLLLICFAVALFGFIRIRRCNGIALPAIAVITAALLSWPPVAWILSRPLESRYPIRPFKPDTAYQAVVVLSSAVSPPQYERPYPVADEDTFHRCRFAAWVYSLRSVPVLACGGTAGFDHPAYSVTMRQMLQQAGVPDSNIWTEEQSTSTRENALYGSAILRQHDVRTVVLVVEASSMRRAQACFQKQGITVIPAPSDFYELPRPLEALIPSWKAVRQNELTLHESIGLAWYRARGWI